MPSNRKPKQLCVYCKIGFVKIEKHMASCKKNVSDQSSNYKCVCGCDFSSFESFDSHLAKLGCIDCSFEHLNVESINLARGRDKPKPSSAGFSSLPFFCCSNIDTLDLAVSPKPFNSYLEKFRKFADNFSILHLNINSVFLKLKELDEILSRRFFDVVLLNETKLDTNLPQSFYINPFYNCIRRDRNRHGGGIMLFVRKEYVISKSTPSADFETIYLKLFANGIPINIFCCYKPPSELKQPFLEHLENSLFMLNPDENLFVIGDLNMDLLSGLGDDLVNFMNCNNLKNFVGNPTRIGRTLSKSTQKLSKTATLIDVVLHNKDAINSVEVLDCPFSDHRFVCTSLSLNSMKSKPTTYLARNLSEKNLQEISDRIALVDFSALNGNSDAELAWLEIKLAILNVIDSVAPIKSVSLKKKIFFRGWILNYWTQSI